MPEASRIPLRLAPGRRLAEEWALVLVAEGLSPSLHRVREGFVLAVAPEEAEGAEAALAAYERENPQEPEEQEETAPGGWGHRAMGLGIPLALLAFFLTTGARDPAVRWFARGSADAERILGGEAWRAVTALTLHADLGHVLANALAGALFLTAVCGAFGPGFGSVLVLLAGACGNLGNAFVHGSHHVSVGASTAVFGAIGLLGGAGLVRRRRRGTRGRRAWVPVASGLALVAMLGTGERVDLWAHLWGFAVGAVLGTGAALAVVRPPAPPMQGVLAALAVAAVGSAWLVALR